MRWPGSPLTPDQGANSDRTRRSRRKTGQIGSARKEPCWPLKLTTRGYMVSTDLRRLACWAKKVSETRAAALDGLAGAEEATFFSAAAFGQRHGRFPGPTEYCARYFVLRVATWPAA